MIIIIIIIIIMVYLFIYNNKDNNYKFKTVWAIMIKLIIKFNLFF